MSISQLVDYFNDRIRADKVRYLPEDPIRIRNGVVEGHFGAIRLQTVFKPRVAVRSGARRVDGHAASLRAYGESDTPIPAGNAFARARDGNAVVYFDRLCRLIHTLNYLRQVDLRHGGEWGSLYLDVHARHIATVLAEHGRYFEQVLEHCGLPPNRVVIMYSPSGDEDEDGLARVRAALQAYRRRDYSVLVKLHPGFSVHQAVNYAWTLLPNQVQIDAGHMAAGTARYPIVIFQDLGIETVASKVRSDIEERRALARGARLLAGDYYGPASDTVRWSVAAAWPAVWQASCALGAPRLLLGYI
jgi:EAL domain-containing protein (putative c-di-GMP-specific phosphodiesterase class I)